RTEYKETFEDLLPSNIKFDEVLRKNKLVTILKECDPHGRRIIIFKFGVWNPSICTLDEFFRASIVTFEYFLLEERFQVAGVVAVVDGDGLSLAHFCYYTPVVIRKLVKLVQVGPCRFFIHIGPIVSRPRLGRRIFRVDLRYGSTAYR
ncbi:unnamed protein product, partial [Ixodes pacificus]